MMKTVKDLEGTLDLLQMKRVEMNKKMEKGGIAKVEIAPEQKIIVFNQRKDL